MVLLYFLAYGPSVEPNQHQMQEVPGALSLRINWPEREADQPFPHSS
jgi:hypothetical protein